MFTLLRNIARLFVPQGEVKELSGTIAIQSVTSGSLDISKKLTGTIACECAVSGSIDISKELIGTIACECTVTGSIAISKNLAGTITCECTVTGSIVATFKLVGTIACESTVSGTITGVWLITGTIVCVCTVSGTLVIPAGDFSNVAENKILEHIVGKTTFTKPTIYLGFCTSDPGESATGASCNEVSNANGYARILTSPSDWNSASSGAIDNANAITSPFASGGGWGTITHYVLVDSGIYGQGDVIVYDELDTPKDIEENDIIEFAAGELNFVLD